MYKSIAVPVDLTHLDGLEKALHTAAEIARHFGAAVTYVGATTPQPNEVAPTPEAFTQKLEKLAADQGKRHGIEAGVETIVDHDPTIDLSDRLLEAIEKIGADLVVMGSHQPGMAEHFVSSHGGYLASHAPVSVMVVR